MHNCGLPLLSAKNWKLRLLWTQYHQKWTAEDITWCDESQILLRITAQLAPATRTHGPTLICVNNLGWWRFWNGVGNVFLRAFDPLISTSHLLNATAYLSVVTDHLHPFITTIYHLLTATSSLIKHLAAKQKSYQTSFEHVTTSSTSALQWSSQSPDLYPGEHLWDVLELEISSMKVKYLQRLHDAIMSTRTRITEECFQHPVQSMPQRIESVLRAKGGPS